MRVAFVDVFHLENLSVVSNQNQPFLLDFFGILIYSLRPHWIIVADLIIVIIIMFLLSFPAFYLL